MIKVRRVGLIRPILNPVRARNLPKFPKFLAGVYARSASPWRNIPNFPKYLGGVYAQAGL